MRILPSCCLRAQPNSFIRFPIMSNTPQDTPQLWSGRFTEAVSERVKRYTASIGFDYRLAEFDIQGSLAHAAMLAHQDIIGA